MASTPYRKHSLIPAAPLVRAPGSVSCKLKLAAILGLCWNSLHQKSGALDSNLNIACQSRQASFFPQNNGGFLNQIPKKQKIRFPDPSPATATCLDNGIRSFHVHAQWIPPCPSQQPSIKQLKTTQSFCNWSIESK